MTHLSKFKTGSRVRILSIGLCAQVAEALDLEADGPDALAVKVGDRIVVLCANGQTHFLPLDTQAELDGRHRLAVAMLGVPVRLVRDGGVVTPECRSGHWVTCRDDDGKVAMLNGQCMVDLI